MGSLITKWFQRLQTCPLLTKCLPIYKVLIIMYKGQFEIYEPKFLTYNAGGTQIVKCWILLEVCGQLFKK